VQAQAGEQAVADLTATKAAEKSRRQGSRRTHLQKGGVLYAETARNMVKRKEEEEVQKAEAALRRAQEAKKRAEKAERKPFLDAVKEKRKKIRDYHSKRKKIMKELCLEIKKVGKERAKKAARVNYR
jgi:DNA-binding transcriptional regulator GbsR (MarR family)